MLVVDRARSNELSTQGELSFQGACARGQSTILRSSPIFPSGDPYS